MAEGAADLGILSGTVDTGSLQTFPFREDRFVLVAARDHPLAARAAIPFAEVLGHDLVGLDRRSAISRFLVAQAVRAGRPMRLRVQLRGFEAVCRLVEARVGLGDPARERGRPGRAGTRHRGGAPRRPLGDGAT